MPIMLANNWENFFKDHPSNKDSNRTMETLFELFSAPKTTAECLQASFAKQDTVFMAKAPILNHIIFIHHVTKIGGTRTNPTEHLFTLVGTGSIAYPGHVAEDSLFTPINAPVPAWTNLKAVDTIEAVDALIIRANAVPKVFRPIMPLPPFMAITLIDQGGSCITDLILTASRSIRSFDAEHGEDATFPSANTHAQSVANWLYAAKADTFPTVTATPSIAPPILEKGEAVHKVHIQAILPPDSVQPVDQNGALDQLATNVNEQTTVLQQINNLAAERSNDKESKKGISAIHPSFKTMILNASSTDGTESPVGPVNTCAKFYAQKSVTHAKIHLLQTLSHVYGCAVEISVPLASALFFGNFLWDCPDAPNNFCSLLFGKPNPLASTGAHEAMLLHLKSQKGNGWSDKDLAKAVQQAITIPATINSMQHSLFNLTAASSLFFGSESLLTAGLSTWWSEISRNLVSYESQAIHDTTFIASILTAIDTRIHCWLQECTTKSLRCNVDDALIDFTDIQRQIKTRQFHFALPPSVRKHITGIPSGSHNESKRSDDDGDRPAKRTPVHNTKRVAKWKLKDGEDYTQVFGGANIDRRLTLNSTNVCPRWHIKGVCWKSCNLASTHCEITDPEVITGMNAYCKLCRG